MNTYQVWRSGGQTAKIQAMSSFEAAVKFLHTLNIHARPFFTGGVAMGSNCAHYTAVHGDHIKIWQENKAD